ncbi:MAG: hypothetical protein ACLS3M_13785 [Collinsella sp.]
MDLNRLILGKSYNSTKVFRTASMWSSHPARYCRSALILLLIWDLTDNPNPVPGVVVIAGMVMLCFFFSYVFVVPDDLTSSATDRTLAIASKIFAYTSRGLTPEAALGASKLSCPRPSPLPSALPTASRCWQAGARTRQSAPPAPRSCSRPRSV